MSVFSEGLQAKYGPHMGIIRFISEQYITLCIKSFPQEKNRDVCILIHRENFSKIRLLKESEK
jgi:hypothetical protein